MFNECKHLQDILAAQIEIIERHIDNHKWFHFIASKDNAIADFIEKYGFIMREFYCSRACKDRFECELAQEYSPKWFTAATRYESMKRGLLSIQ